jgi:hypothetical protein
VPLGVHGTAKSAVYWQLNRTFEHFFGSDWAVQPTLAKARNSAHGSVLPAAPKPRQSRITRIAEPPRSRARIVLNRDDLKQKLSLYSLFKGPDKIARVRRALPLPVAQFRTIGSPRA